MTVQFSGGEPTISPIFLDAVRYARKVGYFSVQAATNGIRFAQDPQFARQAREAGMRIAYLQFDGVSEEANAHRRVGNLFDVKLRAIENLYAAGIDVCLVVTIVNTVNDDQVGPIVKFALQNCDKISFVSFQPVSFTGRDEEIGDEERHAKRYTLSHLAEDMRRQTGVTEPLRDWFPLSASSVMSHVTDLLQGPGADWGSLNCGCHPDCGVGMGFMVSKKTKKWAPLSEFLNLERVMRDAQVISDSARGRVLTVAQTALSLLRNYNPAKAPEGFRLIDLLQKFDKQSGGQLGGRLGACDDGNRKNDEWLLMFVAGHVVSGSVDLRFPAHRDVHHPLRHADGGNLVLRVQHGRRLAANRGEHVSEREGRGLVQRARQASRVRQRAQARAAAVQFDTGDAAHPEGRPAGAMGAEARIGGAGTRVDPLAPLVPTFHPANRPPRRFARARGPRSTYRSCRRYDMKHRISLFIALVTLVSGPALAAGQNPSPVQRFDYLVRADFFAGVAGDETRLGKAIDRCERILEVNPKHPEALVWHGAALMVRAGQAFQKGRHGHRRTAVRARAAGDARSDHARARQPRRADSAGGCAARGDQEHAGGDGTRPAGVRGAEL